MSGSTLKEISKALSMSISTVSRALKNHPDISELTKKKVKELADVLDYEPNFNAINLRAKSNKVFGIMVPSISNSFYDSFMSAVEEEATTNGYSLMIMQSKDNPENELNILRIYKQSRVAGVFACLSPNTTAIEHFMKLNELSIPVVFFDKVPETMYQCTRVCSDDVHVAEQAALVIQNKNNILAIFGNPKLSITKERLTGFKKVFANECEKKLCIEYAENTSKAYALSKNYLLSSQKIDAIFCMSDEILIGVMKAILELKIDYPKQVGIISISDGYFPKIYFPEITHIETSGYGLGKLAYTAMLKRINDNKQVEDSFIVPKLIDLGSI